MKTKTIFLRIGAVTIIVLSLLVYWAFYIANHHPLTGQINPDAPIQIHQKIRINAPVERVWQLISDINHWSEWHPGIHNSKIYGLLQPGTRMNFDVGSLTLKLTLHTVKPLEEIGYCGSAFGGFSIHNWILTKQEGYTEIESIETMEGRVPSILQNPYKKSMIAANEEALHYLKQAAEREQSKNLSSVTYIVTH